MATNRFEIIQPLNTEEMCTFLGIGMTKCKDLCRKKPHGFPVAKNGNRYMADPKKLAEWRDRWFNGEFEV